MNKRSGIKLAKVRQDAWSHEEDLLLAETVLRYIREGGTQLNAFEEVGDELNRTSAACGFRWNAEVRNKYVSAIDLAKRQRKEKKRAEAARNNPNKHHSRTYHPVPRNEPSSSLVIEQSSLTLDGVIQYLQSIQQDFYKSHKQQETTLHYEQENERLQNEKAELQRELNITQKKLATVEEDYKMFIQIMDRARKMAVLEDQDNMNAPTFKMDKNGNLEQLVQESN